VGLLLPLSGPNAALGRALLNAAEMAVFDVADERFVLLPRDTGGRPDSAATAAASVVADGASLILGPVFATSVEAVKPQAQLSDIKVIAFSNDRSVADQGVYLLGLAPEAQVTRIVAYARGQGLFRFATLAPDTPYGQTVVQTYRQAVTLQGGTITNVTFFNPRAGAKELATVVQNFAVQGGGFDAILLPTGGRSLRALAPLLSYYAIDTDKVRLLGTGLWEEPDLGREPALVGGWFVAPPPASRQDFERRYEQLYGRRPPRLATLAYDATALAAVLARNPGSPDFTTEGIAGPNGFIGVDGIFRFLADGRPQRGLAVLGVRRDGFEIIDPAPTTFQQPIN
jgi:ABC-type branched-subunit amino acid transport system substrate-binding protein